MDRPCRARDPYEAPPNANERFKARARTWFWGGLVTAVWAHFLVFAFGPEFVVPETGAGAGGTPVEAVEVLPVRLESPASAPPAPGPETLSEPEAPALPTVAPELVEAVEHMMRLATLDPTGLVLELAGTGPVPEPPPASRSGVGEFARYVHVLPSMLKPELRNRREVRRALERSYPLALERAGVEGEVVVWFWVDEAGAVTKFQVVRSSGKAALDEAALAVVDRMQFTPALERGRPVAAIVAMPIRFQLR